MKIILSDNERFGLRMFAYSLFFLFGFLFAYFFISFNAAFLYREFLVKNPVFVSGLKDVFIEKDYSRVADLLIMDMRYYIGLKNKKTLKNALIFAKMFHIMCEHDAVIFAMLPDKEVRTTFFIIVKIIKEKHKELSLPYDEVYEDTG